MREKLDDLTNISAIHCIAQAKLQARDLGLDANEADIMLAHALQISRAKVMAYPEWVLDDAQSLVLRTMFLARSQGHPIAYLLGSREFFGLRLAVDPSVLIPRPETELLVETALRHCALVHASVLDLGTGSGAIACAMQHERPQWRVCATDINPASLALAAQNAQTLGLAAIRFVLSGWFENLGDQQFDLIVSNPPYIAADDPHLLTGDLRFEPIGALRAAEQGMADLRAIIEGAPGYLRPGGWLMLEHGYDQARDTQALFAANGFISVETLTDMAGHPRLTIGRLA